MQIGSLRIGSIDQILLLNSFRQSRKEFSHRAYSERKHRRYRAQQCRKELILSGAFSKKEIPMCSLYVKIFIGISNFSVFLLS